MRKGATRAGYRTLGAEHSSFVKGRRGPHAEQYKTRWPHKAHGSCGALTARRRPAGEQAAHSGAAYSYARRAGAIEGGFGRKGGPEGHYKTNVQGLGSSGGGREAALLLLVACLAGTGQKGEGDDGGAKVRVARTALGAVSNAERGGHHELR